MNEAVKALVPFGLVRLWKRRHERRRLDWMGVPADRVATLGLDRAARLVTDCRFDLWPKHLRLAPHEWALVDVGANLGQFLTAALGLATPARVIAFEPQPALCDKLRAAVGDRPGLTIRPVAVGPEPGEVKFHVTEDDSCSSVLRPRESLFRRLYGGWSPAVVQSMTVPQVTLDTELAAVERVGLLKLDVQGYELHVLRGATEVLRRTDAILVEVNYYEHYEGAASFDTVHRFLADAGFALTGVSQPFMTGEQIPAWADAVYSNVERVAAAGRGPVPGVVAEPARA